MLIWFAWIVCFEIKFNAAYRQASRPTCTKSKYLPTIHTYRKLRSK